MHRGTLFALAATLLLACGGESPEGADPAAMGSDGADPSSQATAPADDAAAGAAGEPSADASASRRCLQLLSDRDYEGAIPVCTEALALDPSNLDVEHGLAKAKSEVASAAYDAADRAKDAEAAGKKLLE